MSFLFSFGHLIHFLRPQVSPNDEMGAFLCKLISFFLYQRNKLSGCVKYSISLTAFFINLMSFENICFCNLVHVKLLKDHFAPVQIDSNYRLAFQKVINMH